MKFLELPIGQPFWLRGVACRKASHLTYVRLGESMLGEVGIDPDDDKHITITQEAAVAAVAAAPKKQQPLAPPPRGVHVYSVESGEEIEATKGPASPPVITPEVNALIDAAVTDAVAKAVKAALIKERRRVARKMEAS